VSPLDSICAKYEIKKRQFAATLLTERYWNASMNHYLRHQFDRLYRSRSNPQLFWKISKVLLTKSSIYQVYCMNQVDKRWYKTRSYKFIMNCMILTDKILNSWTTNISFKLVDIPKPNGKLRRLGVPQFAWRIALNAIQNIMIVWLSPYMSANQHGFLPGRGCLTAWRALLKNLENSPNIYEFDLEGFFPNLSKQYIMEKLRETKMPEIWIEYIIEIQRTLPVNNEHQPFTSDEEEAMQYIYWLSYPNKNWKSVWEKQKSNLGSILAWKREHEKVLPDLKDRQYLMGIQQGNSMSPLIAILCLEGTLMKESPDYQITQYADDGVLSHIKKPIEEILTFPWESGIRQNKEKSQWIKQDDKWLDSIKFLGLRWSKLTGKATMKGETRVSKSGRISSVIELNETIQKMLDEQLRLEELNSGETSWPHVKWREWRDATDCLEWMMEKGQKGETLHNPNWEIMRSETIPDLGSRRSKEYWKILERNPEEINIHMYIADELTKLGWRINGKISAWKKPCYTFADYFASKFGGWLQAGMYNNTFDLSDMTHEWKEYFHTSSWETLEKKRRDLCLTKGTKYILNGEQPDMKIDVHNMSSLAIKSLANRLRAIKQGKVIWVVKDSKFVTQKPKNSRSQFSSYLFYQKPLKTTGAYMFLFVFNVLCVIQWVYYVMSHSSLL